MNDLDTIKLLLDPTLLASEARGLLGLGSDDDPSVAAGRRTGERLRRGRAAVERRPRHDEAGDPGDRSALRAGPFHGVVS
jgi:hypothetical protein